MKKNALVDLHTHGIGRYDSGTSRPDDILMMAALQAKAGTSGILPTIYSGSIEQMRRNMEVVRIAMETQGVQDRSPVTRYSSRILGVHLEGPFLNPLMCGAQERKSFIRPGLRSLKRLIGGYEDLIRIITIAPEMPGALKVIERCASLGIRVNMGHSDATFRQAINGKKAGAKGISHLFNAMRPLHHREPGLAGFGLMDEDVYIEVIADGVHLHPDTLKLIIRTKRIDRIILVSDTVKGAGQGRGTLYAKPGVLAGGAVTLSGAVNNLVRFGIPRGNALKFASANPLRYLRQRGL